MTEVLNHGNAFCGFVVDDQRRDLTRFLAQISPNRCFLPMKNGGNSVVSSSLSCNFHVLKDVVDQSVPKSQISRSYSHQKILLTGKTQQWWEKGLHSNMKEITSAKDLVNSLLSVGDKLVVVDFFSPGCGGCKALHPKVCQQAEMNPDVQFLQVNYEDQKSMCYSLNVHVLPFFRFYRGGEGRVCSFSCTNATIKKFKDALAKHNTKQCSLGSPRGLEEKELLALEANKDLGFTYESKLIPKTPESTPFIQRAFEVLLSRLPNVVSKSRVVSGSSNN